MSGRVLEAVEEVEVYFRLKKDYDFVLFLITGDLED